VQASEHHFHALAFVENLPLKELSVAYPGARRTLHELSFTVKLDGASDGSVFGSMKPSPFFAASRSADSRPSSPKTRRYSAGSRCRVASM